jgi:hypothetical protein
VRLEAFGNIGHRGLAGWNGIGVIERDTQPKFTAYKVLNGICEPV